MATAGEHAAQRFDEVAGLFSVLSAATRCALVHRLASGPAAVHELVEDVGISQTLASQHLRILRAARLVQADRVGREVHYRLADEHVAHIVGDALIHTEEDG
jgi:ArsR family transcriptional regulator